MTGHMISCDWRMEPLKYPQNAKVNKHCQAWYQHYCTFTLGKSKVHAKKSRLLVKDSNENLTDILCVTNI